MVLFDQTITLQKEKDNSKINNKQTKSNYNSDASVYSPQSNYSKIKMINNKSTHNANLVQKHILKNSTSPLKINNSILNSIQSTNYKNLKKSFNSLPTSNYQNVNKSNNINVSPQIANLKKFMCTKIKDKVDRYNNYKLTTSKLWTIHQLKQFINNIYQSHDYFKEKSLVNNLPHENIEMHMFNYLSNKYGLNSLVEEQTQIITDSINTYCKTDPWVYLFHLVLNNKINEDYRLVLEDMCSNMKKNLSEYFAKENKYSSIKQIDDQVDQITTGYVDYDIIEYLLKNMYPSNDYLKIMSKIKKLFEIEFESEQKDYPDFQDSRDEPVLSYKKFTDLLLEYQIESNLRNYYNFNKMFKYIDKNNNGIIEWNEIKDAFYILKLDKFKNYREIVKKLRSIADHAHSGYYTYSPLFNAFMSVNMEEGKLATIMDYLNEMDLSYM